MMKQMVPLLAKITSVGAGVVAEVAEEVVVDVKTMTIRTNLMSTVARARAAEAVVGVTDVVATMVKASREAAAEAVAKIAATTTRMVANSKPEVAVEAAAVAVVKMTNQT